MIRRMSVNKISPLNKSRETDKSQLNYTESVMSEEIPSNTIENLEIKSPIETKSVTKLINEKKAFLNAKKNEIRIKEPEEDPSLMITKSRIEIPEDILESDSDVESIGKDNFIMSKSVIC